MSGALGAYLGKNAGRLFAIGDVHGCITTFRALLHQLHLQPDDHLILLGDYVNKGPSPLEALQEVMKLQQQGQATALLGNHDLMLLHYLNGDESLHASLAELNPENFFDQLKGLEIPIEPWLESLPLYIISEKHLFVHAGFDFTLENPFLGKHEMLNIRYFNYNAQKANNKTIIHGHFPRALEEIQQRINDQNKIIPLDNGCIYPQTSGQGNLLAYEVNSRQLFFQPYCD